MTTYYICCLDDNGFYKHFEVPKEVSLYVKQLECYIKYPEISKLKEIYDARFGDRCNDHDKPQ